MGSRCSTGYALPLPHDLTMLLKPPCSVVVGYLGRVFKTTDAGATWALALTQTVAELRGVTMVGLNP